MLEKLNNLENKDRVTLFCGIVVIICALFIFTMGDSERKPDVKEEIFVDINEKIDNLSDNYTLFIKETLGEEILEHIFYDDSKLKLYESSTITNGYLKYNDKLFVIDSENNSMKKCNNDVSFISNFYYNYDFIKEFSKSCEFEYVSNNKVKCNLSLNEYLNYYNTKFDTSYSGNDNEFIYIDVLYSEKIKTINIDYTSLDKIIKNENKKHLVSLKFNYLKNDFSKIYDNYKEILES